MAGLEYTTDLPDPSKWQQMLTMHMVEHYKISSTSMPPNCSLLTLEGGVWRQCGDERGSIRDSTVEGD